MRILAIETSCDETGLAILDCKGGPKKPQIKIVKEVVASQIKVHQPFGGVVPNLAKREHIRNLPILLGKIAGISNFQFPWPGRPISNEFSIQSKKLKTFFKTIDVIVVTVGPGLEPALWTGITFAQALGKAFKKPVLGANHMEGHLYSPLLQKRTGISNSQFSILNSKKNIFPAIALIVSGGHTILLRMDSITSWKKLGETRDDAAGEAYDKAARLLDLPYPGGPEIYKLAVKYAKGRKGEAKHGTIPFPQPMLHSKDYDFSFSGLKTAVLYYLKDHPGADTTDVAASFAHAALSVLVEKTFRAVREFGAKSVWLSGGVASDKMLRKMLGARCKVRGIPLIIPDRKHNTDNASMIGAAAYMSKFRKKKYPLKANGEINI